MQFSESIYNSDFFEAQGGSNREKFHWFYAQHCANFVSPLVLALRTSKSSTMAITACWTIMAIYVVPRASQIATAGFLSFTGMRLQKLRRCFGTKIFRRFTVSGGSAQQLSNGNVAFGVTAPSDNPKGSRYMEVTVRPQPAGSVADRCGWPEFLSRSPCTKPLPRRCNGD